MTDRRDSGMGTGAGDLLFQRNLEALKTFHPRVLQQGRSSVALRTEIRPSAAGPMNLFVCGPETPPFAVYPEADPLTGIDAFLSDLGEIHERIIAVMGFGLGYYAVPIWERYRDHNVILLVEAVFEVFEAAMRYTDLRPLLSHPNVRLRVGEGGSLKEILTHEEEVVFATNPPKIIDFKRWTRWSPDWYRDAGDQLDRFAMSVGGANTTLELMGSQFFENKFENLLSLTEALPLTVLANAYRNQPAVVVASGPSLSRNIARLKDIQGRAVIIAVDSAVAPLLQAGVTPDFVAGMDAIDIAYMKVAPVVEALSDVRFIFTPESNPKLLRILPCKETYFVYRGDTYRPVFNELLRCNADGLPDAQSVVHLALFSAQRMGCNPIVFMGLDLAFSEGRDHAEGTVIHWGNHQTNPSGCFTEDIHGKRIPTFQGFLGMLETIEQYIARVPDRDYIDATEGGARKKGTRIEPISAVIDRYCRTPLPTGAGGITGARRLSTEALLENLTALHARALQRKAWLATYFEKAARIDAYESDRRGRLPAQAAFPQAVIECFRHADRLAGLWTGDEMEGVVSDLLGRHNEKQIALEKSIHVAKRSGEPAASLMARYHKQKFMQEIRAEGIEALLGALDRQVTFFTELQVLEQESRCRPDDAALSLKLAGFFRRQGHLRRAERALKGSVGDTPHGQFLRGRVSLEMGSIRPGRALLDEVVRNNPDLQQQREDVIQSMAAAWLVVDHGLGPQGDIFRRRLLELGPASEVIEKLWRREADHAWELLVEGVRSPAIVQIGRMLADWRAYRETASEWKRLTVEWLKRERGVSLERAVALDPSSAGLWEEVGDQRMKTGDVVGAIAAYENSLKGVGAGADVLGKIGDCYFADGKHRAAELAYRTVLSMAPENERAKLGLAKIESLR